ncbi:PREDICTED: uncharacterized protein LOC109313020 [Crocodylus porosus]|uniref:uncharacterized protein LOC109313020 n=1 Tax=Crocodylus porosus TaxID=8502 RepID=UPI00093B7935|nr:PREDICTED: uncharacterized protein LOC109313020 [Crocodylus porosus]
MQIGTQIAARARRALVPAPPRGTARPQRRPHQPRRPGRVQGARPTPGGAAPATKRGANEKPPHKVAARQSGAAAGQPGGRGEGIGGGPALCVLRHEAVSGRCPPRAGPAGGLQRWSPAQPPPPCGPRPPARPRRGPTARREPPGPGREEGAGCEAALPGGSGKARAEAGGGRGDSAIFSCHSQRDTARLGSARPGPGASPRPGPGRPRSALGPVVRKAKHLEQRSRKTSRFHEHLRKKFMGEQQRKTSRWRREADKFGRLLELVGQRTRNLASAASASLALRGSQGRSLSPKKDAAVMSEK